MRYKLSVPMTEEIFELLNKAVDDAHGENIIDDVEHETLDNFLTYDLIPYQEPAYIARLEKLFEKEITVVYSKPEGNQVVQGILKFINDTHIGILVGGPELTMCLINSDDGFVKEIVDEDGYVVYEFSKYFGVNTKK